MSTTPTTHTGSGELPYQPAFFIPLHCALHDISITVEPGDPPQPTPDMQKRWTRACAHNPRLFDGRILRFMAFDTRTRTITARPDTYQRYAMQSHKPQAAEPTIDIYHLAVTGIVTTRDASGNESVLLGKRGKDTFVYPTMWEHAPGGGLDTTDIYTQLLREMEEELNLEGLVENASRDTLIEPPNDTDVLGLAIDPNTPSVDVVVRLRLCKGAAHTLGTASWEYGETRFIPATKIAAFAEQEGQSTIIPPALAIWQGLGWM